MVATVPLVEEVSSGAQRKAIVGDTFVDDTTGAELLIQYLLLGGRTGGQLAIGGLGVADELQLRGSTDAGLGRVRLLSPLEIDNVVAGDDAAIRWRPVFTAGANFVGGVLFATPDITVETAVFIPSLLSDGSIYRQNIAPGFSAHTLFNALPIIRNLGNFDLFQSLVLNAGTTHERTTAGTSTTPGVIGLSFGAQIKASVAGAVMTRTNQTALGVNPTHSTVAGSTVNYGTVRGMFCLAPTVALFQTQAGVENLTAYIGLDFVNITFPSSGDKVVVRSAMTDAANRFFLQNNGGARSNFGGGDLFNCRFVQVLSDVGSLSLGAAGGDMQVGWNGTQMDWDPVIGDDLRWEPFAANYWRLDSPTTPEGLQFDLETIAFGTTPADPSIANYFTIFAAPNLRSPTSAGQYADVLWTAGGTIDINGLAITDLSAFQIDAVSTILNGGTIADSSNLFLNSMASVNATRLQALRVLGRSRLDGLMTHNESTLAQLTANVVQLTLPPNNLGRFVLLEDADALGPWTIRGILNVQVGDAFYIVNTGTNAFLLGHQDAAAAAADRIISPTGAALTLGADEMAKLWYDPVSLRWRILETTGA